MDLYSGPEYVIHFRYANILNITYVTMMYGLGMPILFPIAAFSYFVLYFCARYQVAYTYQMPPALDDLLTKNAANKLLFSPLLLTLNGFWMLSNRQFFNSEVSEIDTLGQTMPSNHTIKESMFSLRASQAFPVLIMSAAFAILIVMVRFFSKFLDKWGFVISKAQI